MAGIFVTAIALLLVLAANTDISWPLTAGERVLDGERLYVDIIETNPPIAVLAYLSGIVLARALKVSFHKPGKWHVAWQNGFDGAGSDTFTSMKASIRKQVSLINRERFRSRCQLRHCKRRQIFLIHPLAGKTLL